MPREPLVVLLGDIHAGSKLAPLVTFTDRNKETHYPSVIQKPLNDFLEQALVDTKTLAKGCDLVLCSGGDLVDGVAHHGSTQTLGDRLDQRDLAKKLLAPWVDACTWGYALLGTDAHVGDNGQEDASVAGELGLPAQHFWRLEIGGRLMDWAHHATGSRRPWLSHGGPAGLANKTYYEYLERKERTPDLIARHHMHFPVHVMVKGIHVVGVAGWQAQTSYSRALDANALLTVGVALWWPWRNEVRQLLYNFPAEPITKVTDAERHAKNKKLRPVAV